jgi:type IV secretory pathway VirB9-like protein
MMMVALLTLDFQAIENFLLCLWVAADKTESLVNTHIDPKVPDVLVIHRVAPEMALRLGNEVVGIFNENYDANGVPAISGTTVHGIKRTIRINKESDDHEQA